MIGRVVGNYKIVQALGEGGVGMVYKGVDTMLDREVAIKVLRPELASQTSVVDRFRSEAVTLAKLNHPNIATLYSLFRQGEDLFMVLEFIKGETLDQLLHRRRVISVDEAIPIFCQALKGINYAHELGIVHRDIKPGNMMLAESGSLKVLDFGIARLLGSNRMTRIGNVIGTLEYMSPEQVRGHETDARSDVYGLGIMLYEMLTGRLPFESENDFALMKMQTETMPHPPRQLNPDIPVEIEEAIMKSVAKDPNARFQSAGEFLDYFLDLGFSLPNITLGFGSMYGGAKLSRPSNPGLNTGEANQGNTSQVQPTEIKGTRFVPQPPTNPNEIKSTELGLISSTPSYTEKDDNSPSFFSNLTWVHYASGSAAAIFLFSLLAFAVAIPFMWGSSSQKVLKEEQANSQPQKNENPNKIVTSNTPSSNPQVVNEVSPQQQQTSQTNIETPPQNTAPIPVITPVPNEPKTVKNQPRETVKNNPAPPKQETKRNNPPPVTRQQEPPRQSGGTKKDLRNILTDN